MLPRDPHEPRWIAWVRNPRVRSTLILFGLWLFIAVALIRFSGVLLPFGLAILLAFIIEPIVAWVSTRSIAGRKPPRIVAIIGVYVVAFLGVGLFSSYAIPQIGHEIAKIGSEGTLLLANVERHTVTLLDQAETFAVENEIPVERREIEDFVKQNLKSAGEAAKRNASELFTFGRDVVAGLVQGVFGLFLVLMLTTFLSLDRKRIEKFLKSLVPKEYQASYRDITSGVSSGLAGVVRGQLLICLTNGVLTFVGLLLFGVKFPLLLATMAAIFSLIPIFGSIISTIPIVAVALTDSFAKGVFALLWIIGIHLVEANLLNPKIMGDAAKIHPVLVVFALIVGEEAAGLIGALFAVPIASVVFTVFKFLHRRALESQASRESWAPEGRSWSGVHMARRPGSITAATHLGSRDLPPPPEPEPDTIAEGEEAPVQRESEDSPSKTSRPAR